MLVVTTTRKDVMPLEQLVQLPEFNRLNQKQQTWIVFYVGRGIATGTYNALTATMFAYNPSKHVEVRAHQLLAKRRIRAVLDLHFRHTELDKILSDLRLAVNKSLRTKAGLSPEISSALLAFESYVATQVTENNLVPA